MCAGTGNDPNAPVANHKTPHHGDPALFWDINNIETVTKHIMTASSRLRSEAAS
jgi:5-methylcytosine-specific restriction enzyme A